MATHILTSYCRFFNQITPLSKGEVKVRFFHDLCRCAEAFYKGDTHEVHVNLAHISLSSILEMGKRVSKGKPLQNHRLISITFNSSGTINHELEHARRGDDCKGQNAHAHGYNVEGQYVDFETCAASYAQKAHQCGLFEEWARDLSPIHFSLKTSALPT